MTYLEQYVSGPASAAQFCDWSAHVDALEHHLGAKTWVLSALTVVLIAVLHFAVPDEVRTVLNLI